MRLLTIRSIVGKTLVISYRSLLHRGSPRSLREATSFPKASSRLRRAHASARAGADLRHRFVTEVGKRLSEIVFILAFFDDLAS